MISKREKPDTPKKKTPNLRNFLTNKLRRASYAWPPRKTAIKKARISRGKYKCVICEGENFGPKDIQLDHIDPVIDPEQGFVDWNTFIERLFCDEDGWQICCKGCHSIKSGFENQIRAQVRQEEKEPEEDI